jgi:hypothetical protein
MKYCLVSEGRVIEGPCFLPSVWKNISGFCNLSNEDLASFGWLPFEVNENHDEENFRKVQSTLEITDTKVSQINEFVERTAEEKEEYKEYLNKLNDRYNNDDFVLKSGDKAV